MNRPGSGTQEMTGHRTKRAPSPRQRLMRRLQAARQQMRGLPGAMPVNRAKPAKGHHAIGWQQQGRRDLVMEALRLGVLVTGKTPEAVGKPGVGQYRTWKALTAAVQRAQRDERASLVDVL